ncbi:hypothetical protein DFP72DRAFT_751269, partial [Ephemerocybe angulata]
PPPIELNRFYDSWQDAQAALEAAQLKLGHEWVTGQGNSYADGNKKKVTFRCKCYRRRTPVHDQTLDPSQHRQGKTAKTDCMAHVNVNYQKTLGCWRITTCDLEHNHPPLLPEGARPRPRPSEKQKGILRTLATNVQQTFTQAQAAEVLSITAPDEPKLEGRQISYFLTKERKEARDTIKEQGGDCQAIVD